MKNCGVMFSVSLIRGSPASRISEYASSSYGELCRVVSTVGKFIGAYPEMGMVEIGGVYPGCITLEKYGVYAKLL